MRNYVLVINKVPDIYHCPQFVSQFCMEIKKMLHNLESYVKMSASHNYKHDAPAWQQSNYNTKRNVWSQGIHM